MEEWIQFNVLCFAKTEKLFKQRNNSKIMLQKNYIQMLKKLILKI